MAASTAADAPSGLRASAFKRIYPEQYYAEFISRELRPDGRKLEEARPATIGVGTIQSADSSALVKLGNTTVLAGVKLEVGGCTPPLLGCPSDSCGRRSRCALRVSSGS